VKFPKLIWVDAADRAVVSWARVGRTWTLAVVSAPKRQKGVAVQPKLWIVERTFGWVDRSRRLSEGYEQTLESSIAFVAAAMIELMIRRL
jgi:putative transposase